MLILLHHTQVKLSSRYGDPERGKTLFETILSNFPRRTDVWSVYVDQVSRVSVYDDVGAWLLQ